jgi:hypothetical protein
MIRKSILLLAVLGIATLFIASCNGSTNPANPDFREWGTMRGLIVDGATNEPIDGATVDIKSIPFGPSAMVEGVIIKHTASGLDGSFQRVDIPIGNIQVRVKKAGYKTPDIQNWSLTASGTGFLVFTLYPGVDPVEKFTGNEMTAWDPTDLKH